MDSPWHPKDFPFDYEIGKASRSSFHRKLDLNTGIKYFHISETSIFLLRRIVCPLRFGRDLRLYEPLK